MTRLREYWHEVKLLVAVGLLLVVSGFCGAWVQQDHDSAERAAYATERATLLARFPVVRAQATEACEKTFAGKLDDQKTIKKLVSDMDTYLHQRAGINDKRSAILQKQAKTAAIAAVDASQKAEQLDQKVNAAVAKVDDAASGVKSLDKKLETALPASAPSSSSSWFSRSRH